MCFQNLNLFSNISFIAKQTNKQLSIGIKIFHSIQYSFGTNIIMYHSVWIISDKIRFRYDSFFGSYGVDHLAVKICTIGYSTEYTFFLGNALKKLLKFPFLFESTILPIQKISSQNIEMLSKICLLRRKNSAWYSYS